MDRSHRHLTAQLTDFWLARGAILVIVMLQIGIVNDLAVGPRWLAPSLELALLIPVSLATAWMQQRARGASTDAQWASIGRHRRMVRRLAFVLTAICTLMNFGALGRLIAAILAGHAGSGKTLLLDATNIWATNVVIFALWFWSLDRGGLPQEESFPRPKAISCLPNNKRGSSKVNSSKIGRPDLSCRRTPEGLADHA